MRRQLKNFDYFLFGVMTLLIVFGIVMISSAVRANMSDEGTKQIIFFGFGLVLLFAAAFIDYNFICQFYIVIYILCILMLVGVLVYGNLYGDDTTARWFEIGPIKIQPSEFTKIFMIIFLATIVDKYKENLNTLPVLALLAATIGLPVFLVMKQPALSAGLIILSILLPMLFVAGLSFKLIFSTIGVVIPLSFLAYKDVLLYPKTLVINKIIGDYQVKRLFTYFTVDPDAPPTQAMKDAALQQTKSIEAIASGQFSGKGLFSGLVIQSGRLPHDHNDFIFGVIGEELGFVGSMIALVLILLIIAKCMLTAQAAADLKGRLIATGVTAMLAFQTFANVAVATGLFPNTGIPLPFLGYGGSSLWINMVGIGLVINVGMTRSKSLFEG